MHTRHLIVAAYLHVLAFSMLSMGTISLIGYLLLGQPTRHNVVLLPDSALMSVLMGGLILAATRQTKAALNLLTSLLVALTLYSLLHNLLAGSADIDHSWLSGFLRIRSSLALSMLLATLALYLSGRADGARRGALLLGGALMSMAALSHLADNRPALAIIRLGFKYDASHVANLFVLGLGLGIIMLSLRPHTEHDRLDPRTLSAGIFGTLLACSSWYLLSTQAINTLSREGDLLLEKVASATTQNLQSHLALMQRMAERWQITRGTPTTSLWQLEAHSYLRDFPHLKLLALLNNDLEPSRLEARNPAQAFWLRQLIADSSPRSWLQQVRDGAHPQISETRDYGDATMRNALIATPIHQPDQPALLLVASLNMAATIESLLGSDLNGFTVQVREGDQLLYDSSDGTGHYATPVSQRDLQLPQGQTWHLRAYVDNPQALNAGKHLATLTLLFGLALSFFLLLSQRLAWLANERAQQLQESRQRFRSLFAFNPDPVFSFDLHGNVLSINDAGQQLLGLSETEIIGQRFTQLIASDQQAHIHAHLQAASVGTPQHYEMQLQDRQQKTLTLDVTNLPIMVDAQIVGVFGIAKDVSERHQTQQVLKATLLELERSNKELQEFAYVASHDLQEPLRKIQAFSELLASRSMTLDDEGRDYLQRMTSAAARMQALIIDLLNYSRVNTSGQPLQRLDLNQVLREVLADMEATIEQSQARIEYPPLPAVLGDASQLRQVLQNLLSNAIKFQSPGNHPLIRLTVEAKDSTHWTLCIADNGIGFDEKYLDRIFNPFQRLHGRDAYAGTGIGLAIVKKIIERHGARITASSAPGQGSVFRITFVSLEGVKP